MFCLLPLLYLVNYPFCLSTFLLLFSLKVCKYCAVFCYRCTYKMTRETEGKAKVRQTTELIHEDPWSPVLVRSVLVASAWLICSFTFAAGKGLKFLTLGWAAKAPDLWPKIEELLVFCDGKPHHQGMFPGGEKNKKGFFRVRFEGILKGFEMACISVPERNEGEI